jgi:hypothetical protein
VASGSPEPFITWIREDGREIRINRNSSGSGIKGTVLVAGSTGTVQVAGSTGADQVVGSTGTVQVARSNEQFL